MLSISFCYLHCNILIFACYLSLKRMNKNKIRLNQPDLEYKDILEKNVIEFEYGKKITDF